MNDQSHRPGIRVKLLVYAVGFLTLLVPFLFWKGVWFGERLSDLKMKQYLQTNAKPRETQHALFQISEEISRGEVELARRWYPFLNPLVGHPVPEVRVTLAWLMGQDHHSQELHQALTILVQDSNPLVRRNAALSLVRFADERGRPEILNMLRPFTVRSTHEGLLTFRLKEDDSVSTGTLLARIKGGEREPHEIRSPLPGFVESKLVEDGKKVVVGQEILVLAPTDEQVWEALRALYLVGKPQDLGEIERFSGKAPHMGERIRQQARLTINAINSRGATEGNRSVS